MRRERRGGGEVRGYGAWRGTPADMANWNPRFGGTPVGLVTSLVLDRGVYSADQLRFGVLAKVCG